MSGHWEKQLVRRWCCPLCVSQEGFWLCPTPRSHTGDDRLGFLATSQPRPPLFTSQSIACRQDQLTVSCSPMGTWPHMEVGANRHLRHPLIRQEALTWHNVLSCSFLQQSHRKSLFSTKYGFMSPGRCDAGRCAAQLPACLAAGMAATGVIICLVS